MVYVMKNPPWTDLGGFCGFGWDNHYLFKVNYHNTNAFKDWCMFGGCMDTIKAKPFNEPMNDTKALFNTIMGNRFNVVD